ncbi:hypothetical protein MMC08_003380 [Hypocenomyce scalaris]|nr:hypothetical protein [Hypocenomyce scalaris]
MAALNMTAGVVPPPPGVLPDFVHPISHQGMIVNTVIACTAIAGSFVLMRLWTKIAITRQLWWDDLTCVLSLVFIAVDGAGAIEQSMHGAGLHLWDIQLVTWLVSDFEPYLIWNVVSYTAYMIAMGFIKLSILLLYLKLLAPGMGLRWAVYALIAFVAMYTTATTLSLLFGCSPIAKLYHSSSPGTCINLTVHSYAQSGLNITSDVLIMLIPVPMVWRLQMKTKFKLGVVGIFATGIVVTVLSIVRLVSLYWSEYQTDDGTWEQGRATILSIVEVNLAIIASCMPAFKPFLSTYLPFLSRPRSSQSCPTSPRCPQSKPSFVRSIPKLDTESKGSVSVDGMDY